jgi:glucose/arabinose dehydrogenase
MQADGSDRQVVARGVRNSVGFDWHPVSGDFWFTDNGRDMLGDNRPPCELNRLTKPGAHYGFPYVHGATILDPEFGEGVDPDDYVAPAQELGPHVAPLGLEFYDGTSFPWEYFGRALIAEHGSWNRSKKIGYRVTMVRFDDNGNAVSYEPFVDGWLQDEKAWGRPVDLEIMPDGSLLISDDRAGLIYRVTYGT